MLTPIELIKATVDRMIARKFGRIVNITSSAVKAPIDVLGLSNGARTGLTGFVAGLARQTVPAQRDDQQPAARLLRHRPAALGDGGVREEPGHDRSSRRRPSASRASPPGRFGDPAEFGEACAFLCSAQTGYVTGQNFLIDGGVYPGTF